LILREGRHRGFALTTTDALIAAIAIEKKVEVFTTDKNFERIARFTGLQLYRPC
jgi:predicted nucleic acid-binding protein